MKIDSIEPLTGINTTKLISMTDYNYFPDSREMREYQKLSHKLRSQAVAGSWRLISGYFSSHWSKLKKLMLQRKALAELEQLDSFMLKDIGITRGDIDRIRQGATTVKVLNQRRVNAVENHLFSNRKVDLQVCQCNEKVIQQSLAENPLLAKCG